MHGYVEEDHGRHHDVAATDAGDAGYQACTHANATCRDEPGKLTMRVGFPVGQHDDRDEPEKHADEAAKDGHGELWCDVPGQQRAEYDGCRPFSSNGPLDPVRFELRVGGRYGREDDASQRRCDGHCRAVFDGEQPQPVEQHDEHRYDDDATTDTQQSAEKAAYEANSETRDEEKFVQLQYCMAANRKSLMNLTRPHQVSITRLVCFACLSFCILSITAVADTRRVELENGDIYEGDFVDGVRTGSGTYVWANGNEYQGDFLTNQMHGEGTYRWTDGRTYIGSFIADKRNGRGTLTWLIGNSYEGDFVEGEMHGQGVFRWINEDRYEGDFVRGARTGHGQFDWATGERFEGSFVDGDKAGRGTFEWPNGNRYYGDFTDDQRNGLGIFYWRDGTIYRGQFRNDKMHGHGVKQQPDGPMELQRWDDGDLVLNEPLEQNARCRLEIQNRAWMFRSETCVNGLAHGRGLAASLDGELIIVNGRFVLGHFVEGDRQSLKLGGT